MRELVGHGVSEEQQVGIDVQCREDVIEIRVGGVLPHQTLLDVGVLVDDQRLDHGEVGRGRTREVLVQRLLEAERRSAAGRVGAPVVGRVCPRDRGEVDPELGEIGGDVDRLQVEARSLAGTGARKGDLDVRPVTGAQIRDGRRAVLGGGRRDGEHLVVVGGRVIRRVVDVEVVKSIDVVRRRERCIRHLQLLLLGRAEGSGYIRPARGRVEVDPLI